MHSVAAVPSHATLTDIRDEDHDGQDVSFAPQEEQSSTTIDETQLFSRFSKTEETAVLIDGANTHHAAALISLTIDMGKMRTLISRFCDLQCVYFFTAVASPSESYSSKLRSQLDWMQYNGFRVIQKPAKILRNAAGDKMLKGNMDIEMAVYALEYCSAYKHIVLLTGDGDFRILVEALQNRGKRVSVISTISSEPIVAADELRRQVDSFIDLSDIKHLIARRHPNTPPVQGVVKNGRSGG